MNGWAAASVYALDNGSNYPQLEITYTTAGGGQMLRRLLMGVGLFVKIKNISGFLMGLYKGLQFVKACSGIK